MSDKLIDTGSKSSTPILIIIICASINMLVQTIASAITVMGYDEVIRADAKARAEKILKRDKLSPKLQAKLDLLESQVRELMLDNEVLKENSHKPGG